MNRRRSDYDVTNRIQVTDWQAVCSEVERLFLLSHPRASFAPIGAAFADLNQLYSGDYPGYLECETPYHNLQHALDVTLTMARLLDGYRLENSQQVLATEECSAALIAALFHDSGYIRKSADHSHRHGAEYTRTHVSRSRGFIRQYLDAGPLAKQADMAATIISFTGHERPRQGSKLSTIQTLLGCMLGTADLITQMADRCYLEKCRDRLYPEFEIAGLAGEQAAAKYNGVAYSSVDDMLRKSPAFYSTIRLRLDEELQSVYRFAACHFGGTNLYLEAMERNHAYLRRVVGQDPAETLRRDLPADSITGN